MSAKADRIDGRETPAVEAPGPAQPDLRDANRDVTWEVLSRNINDLIVLADTEGRIFYVSPSCRSLGYAQHELIGRAVADLVHPDDLAHFEANTVALFAGERTSAEADPPHRFRRADGSWAWLEGNPGPLAGPDGAPMGLINVFRDVTEKQALKAQLDEALAKAEQATGVKAEFLANMSHEIRTPLTAVLGFASLLAERTDLDETAQGQVGRIAGAGRALLAVINDVLDFAKVEAGEITIRRRPTCPEQTAREVLEMFALQAGAKGLELRFDVAAGLPRSLVLDEDRLRQILVNLVGNAVKFTDRGRVAVALSYDAEERLVIEVSDTGPGISAAAKAKLFQLFSQVDGSSTRTKGGSGLGLAICRGLAQAMGGTVGVKSRVGRGSTFRLVLPAQPAVADAATGTRASDLEQLYGVRVLVVDDNAVNRELARAILESVGAEVTEVHDGTEAVEIAQRVPFDIILMDLRMPGLDGRSATAAIRREPGPNQHMPVLAFSADGIMDLAAPQNLCFQGVVLKPTSPADLFRALLRALAAEPALAEGTPHAAQA
jgi:PAS domain S-box-containing protein